VPPGKRRRRGGPGARCAKQVRRRDDGTLPEAPLVRTVTFMVVGLIVFILGIATLTY